MAKMMAARKNGQVIQCGTVTVFLKKTSKQRYLKITCGISKEQPARLELFTDVKSAAKGKSKAQEILFHAIDDMSIHEDRSVSLKTSNGTELWFCAESHNEQEKWIQFCTMLHDLPYYFIPQTPNYNLIPRNFVTRYDDPTEFNAEYIWVVNIIHKGAGLCLNEGLYIAAIYGSTFRLYDCSYHDQSSAVYSWNSVMIKWFGHVESLVFIETTGEYSEGSSLLWMDCKQSSDICECLFKLCNPQRNRHFSDSGLEDSAEIEHDTGATGQSHHEIHPPFRKQRVRSSSTSSSSLPDPTNHTINVVKSKQSVVYCNTLPNLGRHESSDSVEVFYSHDTDELSETCAKVTADISKQNFHTTETMQRRNDANSIPKLQESLANNVQVSSDIDGLNTAMNVWTTLRSEKIETMALEQCLSVIKAKLDAVTLHPLLCAKQLLTDLNSLFLLNESRPDEEKAHYLVRILPRKQEGWFWSFLDCLQCSTRGTGHDMVYKALVSKHNELTSTHLPDNKSTTKEDTHDKDWSHSDEATPVSVTIMRPHSHSPIPPNIKNITELVIPNMAPKWFEMGLQLGIDENELETIKHDNSDSKTAARMMFTEWLRNTQKEKSWESLLEALQSQSVGESCLASTLIKKLK